MTEKNYEMNYEVIGKDYFGKVFIKCECACISDAVKMYNSFSAWNKYILDLTTGEVLVYDSTEFCNNALEIKR